LAQGICLQGTEIAARIDAESAENAVFAGNFLRFPVKFPVLREFETIGQTVGSSMIVVDAIDEREGRFTRLHPAAGVHAPRAADTPRCRDD
jgi:hypothetical protein